MKTIRLTNTQDKVLYAALQGAIMNESSYAEAVFNDADMHARSLKLLADFYKLVEAIYPGRVSEAEKAMQGSVLVPMSTFLNANKKRKKK